MTDEKTLARVQQQQTELGCQLLRLMTSQQIRHELQLSTLICLIEFLAPLHPCCLERVSGALLSLGIRFAELTREQESAIPHLH